MDKPTSKMGRGRRRLIKALASGGAVVAAGNLPRHWNKPVVDSVMLPAHAQTSAGQTFYGEESFEISSAPQRGGETLVKVLDALVPTARAGNAPSGDTGTTTQVAVTIGEDGGYEFVLKQTDRFLCQDGPFVEEFSSFHTGTGSDGVAGSAPGTDCAGGNAPANLTVAFMDGYLIVSGDVDGADFEFRIFPGGTVPTPSPCVDCPISEEAQ